MKQDEGKPVEDEDGAQQSKGERRRTSGGEA